MSYKPTKPNHQQGNVTVSQTAIQVKSQILPDPKDLEQYERHAPGITQRLLAITEKEQEHRHALDHKDHSRIVVGQVFALIAVILVVGLCAFLAYHGFGNEAAWVAGSVIVSVVVAFLGLKSAKAQKNIKSGMPEG